MQAVQSPAPSTWCTAQTVVCRWTVVAPHPGGRLLSPNLNSSARNGRTVHEGAGLVQELGGEADAEFGGHAGDAAFPPAALGAECLRRLHALVELCRLHRLQSSKRATCLHRLVAHVLHECFPCIACQECCHPLLCKHIRVPDVTSMYHTHRKMECLWQCR